MINKTNYEIWFIDYLDGKLSVDQVAELLLFVDEHPELGEELDGMSDVVLSAEAPKFPNKSSLMKSELPVSEADVHLLLARKLEGDLSPEDLSWADELISSHEEVARAWSFLSLTKLSPETIEFADKSKLLKPVEVVEGSDDLLLAAIAEGDAQLSEAGHIKNAGEEVAALGKMRLVSDDKVVFPNKNLLKRKAAVVRPMWFRYAQAAAAVALLVLGWRFFQDPQPITGDGLASHSGIVAPKLVEVAHQVEGSAFSASEEEGATTQQSSSSQLPTHIPEVHQPTFAYITPPSLIEGLAIRALDLFAPERGELVASNSEFVVVALREGEKDIDPTINPDYQYATVKDFMADKAKAKIWGSKDYPEEDFTIALAEKAMVKINDRTGSDLAVVPKDARPNDSKGFYFRIGAFEIKR
jgi:hypothetical protein